MFDVERVNPPGYVRDPAFMAPVHSASCCQVSASPSVGFETSSAFLGHRVRVWRFTCGDQQLLPGQEVLRAHPHVRQ